MTQTKKDTLVLQVGGWAGGKQPHPVKKYCYETSRGGQGPPRAVEPMMMMIMMMMMMMIEKLKRHKSPDIDQIPAEPIIARDRKSHSEIHDLINSILKN
jgi:hypothetical protein